MFLTYQHAKIDQFGLFGDDPTAWSYVEHNIHRPWFYVAATGERDDEFAPNPMLMLTNDQLLRSLMEDQENGVRMESVLLVTPDHVNQSGRWMMEPLESIVRSEAAEGIAYTYTVEGDKTYVCGDADVASLEGARRKTLFSSSMLSCSEQ